MPRRDLASPLVLSELELDKVARAIIGDGKDRERSTAIGTGLREALLRYPGDREPDDCLAPNVPLKENVYRCLREVNGEKLLGPFLSRVVEWQWGQPKYNAGLLAIDQVADLVLAPDGLQRVFPVASNGVKRLLSLISDEPKYGAVGALQGDEKAFAMVCRNRAGFLQLRDTLGQLKALKGVHDALHVLQLASADWLEPIPDDDDDASPIVLPVAALAGKVKEAEAIVARIIPSLKAEHMSLGQRAAASLTAISGELTHANAGQQAAGLERLRQLLMSIPPEIDAAIFGLSRDLPVRDISRAFGEINDPADPQYVGFDRVREAMALLGEALRGRVLEHAMWQATDLRLYKLENTLSDYDAGFLTPFQRDWNEVKFSVRLLFDSPHQDRPPDMLVNMALDAYDRALQAQSAGLTAMPLVEAFDQIVRTFNSLKALLRNRFLEVDKALKEELEFVGALATDLDTLLDRRVRERCENLLTKTLVF